MSRFNTGNPLGSNDPRDLDDNAKNMDLAVNADQDTFQDRLGKSRLTWAGIEKAGSGDPAIAVDAAARAEAAASQVQQDAAQIAHDAAEQAVVDVVNAVDGAVGRAESAADAAQAAADAAFINADVYPDVASGRAAVADGEQFQVVEGDEIARYRRDSASEQTEVARYPSSSKVDQMQQDAYRLEMFREAQPNLLGSSIPGGALNGETLFGTATAVKHAGLPALRIVGDATSARERWVLPAALFKSGRVSASLFVAGSSPHSNVGRVRVIQRSAAGSQLVFNTLGVLSPSGEHGRVFAAAGIPLDPAAVSVELDAELRTPGGTLTLQFPMLADGDVAGYRPGNITAAPYRFADAAQYGSAVSVDLSAAVFSPAQALLFPEFEIGGLARSFSITSMFSPQSDARVAVPLGSGAIGASWRVTSVLAASKNDPAIGIAFGSDESYLGVVFRESGQVFRQSSDGSTSGSSYPATGGYGGGDRVVVTATVTGQSSGGYVVEYVLNVNDLEYGPYTGTFSDISKVYVLSRGRADWGGVVALRPVVAQNGGEAGERVVYVSPSGSDQNSGEQSEPFATLGRAVQEIGNAGVIELQGGDYRETVSISSSADVWIRSANGERARILGSDQLVLTKTPGMGQVYQAPLASKPVGMGGNRGKPTIFDMTTPSKPIPADEYHPLQRGASYRLPYTEMFEAQSLAELDTVDGRGKWWWESGVLYLAALDGGDATGGRYEARVRPTLVHTGGKLRLSRTDIMFSSTSGAVFEGHHAVTEDIGVFGCYQNGFFHRSGVWHSFRDEAAGNGNDGFNGTVSDTSSSFDRGNRITAVLHDPYGHDNGDDGTSYHYRGDQTIHGGLFEHNTKADVVHVTGAACTCYGTVARGSDHGFYTATAPAGDPSRQRASFRCVGTVAIDHLYSYRALNGSVLECSQAVAVNPSVYGYSGGSGSVLVARNSKYTGDPAKMKGGAVEVINDGALT